MPTPTLPDHILQEAVNALAYAGSKQAAAKVLNLPRGTFKHRLRLAAERGISDPVHGWSPEHDLTHVVPAPYVLKGASSYYNKEGKLAGQWVKTTLDQRKAEEAMRAAVEALAETIPRAESTKQKWPSPDNLCNLYTLTDVHVGMRAWEPETGADWDLDIAEDMLTRAFEYLVTNTLPAKVGFVNNLGDFLHYDSLSPVTPTNQHPLDADSRYSKMVKVAVRILRRIIDSTLTRHEKVVVLMADGNHDQASSVWLRHLFSLLYENEPRVEVINCEMPYYAYVHGKTMLAFHHGHLAKNEALPGVFAAQYAKEWGATTKRYCHVGHRHHEDIKEFPGMKVHQHSTLSARDAYAARGGWFSERQIEAITYHAEFGKAGSVIVTPEML